VMLSPAQYEGRIPLFENFIPGIQNEPPQVDDGVAPSSLDVPKEGLPSGPTGYSGGGIY
jgi:hypothetical protein